MESLLPALPGYDDPRLIAHGTTALVFRAIQTRLSRPVAIKVITVDTGSVPVNAARELATTVALSSQPHIVSIIDTGVTEDDRPYIVMEYCEGGSYAQILRQGGPLPVDEVVEVGVKIGEALHAAHQVGIVHRDVKPSNILRGRFGPALTDFGIARAPDELGGTLTREMMTPHHASPEALLHQAQSGPSDVYSLASTMWALLVGHPPFVEPSKPMMDIYAFRDRVLHDPLPPIPREDVPAWLLTELTRAMAKMPAQRHASAMEFAVALRRGALGLPPPAPIAGAEPAGPVAVAGRASVLPVIGQPAPRTPARPVPAIPPVARTPAASPPPAPPPPTEPNEPIEPYAAAAPARFEAVDADDGDDGWLGPPPEGGRGPALEPTAAQPYPLRRFEDGDLIHPAGRRTGLVAILVAVAVLAVAVAAALMLNAGRRPAAGPPTVAGSPTDPPTAFITASATGAPREVRLNDRGNAVTLTWNDPSDGTVSFLVVGSGPAGQPLDTKQVQRGSTSVTYSGLDRTRNYCFVVGAVYAVDRVATAAEICTRR